MSHKIMTLLCGALALAAATHTALADHGPSHTEECDATGLVCETRYGYDYESCWESPDGHSCHAMSHEESSTRVSAPFTSVAVGNSTTTNADSDAGQGGCWSGSGSSQSAQRENFVVVSTIGAGAGVAVGSAEGAAQSQAENACESYEVSEQRAWSVRYVEVDAWAVAAAATAGAGAGREEGSWSFGETNSTSTTSFAWCKDVLLGGLQVYGFGPVGSNEAQLRRVVDC